MTIIYVELHSGFGNQLFQYAFALFLQQYGFTVYILPSRGNQHSFVNYQKLFTLMNHATYEMIPQDVTIINKKSTAFDFWDVLELSQFKAVRLSGYHQNYRLFGDANSRSISQEMNKTFKSLYGSPSWNPQTTGFIHIRRTNYMLPHIKMYNLTMDYYNDAIKYIESKKPVESWLVITDDIEWCKLQTWPENARVYEETEEQKCFWALTQCQGAAIIANSTFSYWGAMAGAHLNLSPVVYPNAWHLLCPEPDLFPTTWIGLGSKEKSLKIY